MADKESRFRIVTWALLAVPAACSQQSEPAAPATRDPAPLAIAYAPASTLQEIMDSVVDPAADAIWDAVSFTSDASGTHEKKPTTAEEWHQLRRASVVLVESANLLAVPGRKVAVTSKTLVNEDLDLAAIQQRLDTRHAEFSALASALRDVGLKLIAAADRQDVEAITELGGKLDEVCEACHRPFWYPEAPPLDAN
jgi:hypothetical protein